MNPSRFVHMFSGCEQLLGFLIGMISHPFLLGCTNSECVISRCGMKYCNTSSCVFVGTGVDSLSSSAFLILLYISECIPVAIGNMYYIIEIHLVDPLPHFCWMYRRNKKGLATNIAFNFITIISQGGTYSLSISLH